MGMYGNTGGSDGRMEEKAEMNVVNDKLATYIQKVRQMGLGDTDPAVFLETLKGMENDVKKMKCLYESELEKCRQKLEEANRQKNAALTEIETNKRAARDFEDRFRAECDKNRKLMNDINGIQKRVSDLERELAGARSAAQGPQALLSNIQSDLSREHNKNKQLANELDQEKAKNKQLEDRVKTLLEKNKFNDELSNEEKRDVYNRLEEAKKVISDLEAKNRELEKQCASLPEVVGKLKRKTEQEMQQIKAEMENNNKKNNDAIKRQLNEQSRTNEQLKADNAKLEKENHRLMAVLRTLEANLKIVNNEKATLEEQMRCDKSKANEQIRALERKLKELQDLLVEKMQEVNTSRDVSLRPEIECAKILLEEEENRLNARQSSSRAGYSRGNLSSGASSQYGFNRRGLGSSGGDRQGDKLGDDSQSRRITATKGPGQQGKRFEQRTEYQFSYNKPGGRFPFGSYGRSNKGGLPILTNGGCNSGNGTMRRSMPN